MSMRAITSRLLALLILVASASIARAQALADRVPANSIIYVGWNGVEGPGKDYEGSHLQAVLKDSSIPAFVNEFLPKVLDRLGEENRDAAEAVRLFKALATPMWKYPTAFSFAGVEVDPNTGPRPKFSLISKAGADAADMKKELDALVEKAGRPPFPVKIVEQEGFILVTVGYDKAEDASPSGADAKSLANDANFKKALDQVGKESLVTVYVDIEGVLKLVEMGVGFSNEDIKAKWEKARDMIGLQSLKRAIFTAGFDGKDWSEQGFVAAPAPRTGMIARMMSVEPLSEDIMHSIPKNATVAGAGHFDLNGAISALRQAASSLDPDTGKQVDEAFDKINEALGLDLQKDVLSTLGEEWAYYMDPAVAGQGWVGTTVINRLKDPAKATEVFGKLEEHFNSFVADELRHEKPRMTVAFRQVKLGDVTVHFLALPIVSPSWAVADGNLYLGLYPEIVAAASKQVSDKLPALTDNPDAQEAYRRLGEHPVTSFQYVDLPRLAPQTYGGWLVVSHVAGFGDLFGVQAPPVLFPSLKTIQANLTIAGQISWVDDDGLHVHTLSPFPFSMLLASDPTSLAGIESIAVVPALMMPALQKAREAATVTREQSNLKQIALGVIIYANNHNKMPQTLGDIAMDGGVPTTIFVSPRMGVIKPPADGAAPNEIKDWINQNSNYIYNTSLAGKNMADVQSPSETLMAWENPSQSGSRVSLAYVDGHVESVDRFTAEQKIEAAKNAK